MNRGKYILPVVAGALAGMMLIRAGERLIHQKYSLPEGLDPQNKEALKAAIAAMPSDAFLMLLLNYAIGSFVAGLVGTLVAKRESARPAVAIGMLLTVAGLVNIIAIPNPVWFSVANLAIYFPMCYLGYLVSGKKGSVPR